MTSSPSEFSYVLIVEDDPDIADVLQYNFRREGYATVVASDGLDAIEQINRATPSLVIMDIMMPRLDGISTLKKIKCHECSTVGSVPVILLTAKSEETDIVVGLELGADDYLTKPFSPRELLARVRALLRRSSTGLKSDDAPKKQHGLTIAAGPIEINLEKHEVQCGGQAVPLTLAEFKLLKTLVERPGHVFTREKILSAVAGSGTVVIDRNVDVHVRAVRKKLDHHSDYIQTVRGVGYKFRAELTNP